MQTSEVASVIDVPEATIERLKRGRLELHKKSEEGGKEHGRKWATETAEYEELKAVVDLEDVSATTIWEAATGEAVDYGVFWESTYGEGFDEMEDNEVYLDGFINGASEVWLAVKDRVEA